MPTSPKSTDPVAADSVGSGSNPAIPTSSGKLASSARSLAEECESFADQLDPQPKPADAIDASITKLIVAVHGIGDQFRFATIESVAHQIAKFCGTPIPYPLGRFHAPGGAVRATLFEIPADKQSQFQKFAGLGFAEVFWADIHQEAQKTGDTIEESKAWAQTMVDRMQYLDQQSSPSAAGGIAGAGEDSVDYKKTAAVVAEMIETIATLENLCFLAEKMGLGKFELRSLLDDYLGAVQLVAEFQDYGGKIFDQFTKIMRALAEQHKNVREIYIVAHSEGTVVSFHSLLAALSVRGGEDEKWVKLVRGYMTIGSPIDKHVVMWQDLWKKFHEKGDTPWADVGVIIDEPILWWNYYDNGDPVGFMLDSTRVWLQDHLWVTVVDGTGEDEGKRVLAAKQPFFDFSPENDKGFTRYYLPGKAHNDYWDDEGVFGHFIDAVMKPRAPHPRPESKFWPRIVSWVVPYVICLLLLAGGNYLIYRAVDPLLKAAPAPTGLADAVEKLKLSATNTADLATNIAKTVSDSAGSSPDNSPAAVPIPKTKPDAKKDVADQSENLGQTTLNLLGLTCLLAGITVATRIPRLVKSEYWHLVSVAIFLLGTWIYLQGATPRVQHNLADSLKWIPVPDHWRIILMALVIAIVSSRVSKRRPDWGMRPLMFLAGVATVCIVGGLLHWGEKDFTLWPLLLAGTGFLYLWWLAALIFDLIFVWHRYIRLNETPKILKGIREKRRTAVHRARAATPEPTSG